MKKLSPFNAQFITDTYFPEYKDYPADINYGQCFEWAYLAFKTFSKIELWDLQYHAFVKYKGKFYDSETLNGVKDWRELPIVRANGATEIAHKSGELRFKMNWGFSRKKFQLSWKKLREQAKDIVRRKQI